MFTHSATDCPAPPLARRVKPKTGQGIKAHYSGYLLKGAKFDSSYERRKPLGFDVGTGRVSMVKVPPLAAPQLAACASSARAWRLRAARHSQSEAQPLGAPPPPRVAELAASKVADFTAFD